MAYDQMGHGTKTGNIATMADRKQKKGRLLDGKAAISLILATAAVVSGIWAFFFTRTSSLKEEQIRLLDRQLAQAREIGKIPESVKRLEERLIPLTLAFPMDQVTGEINVGTTIKSGTEITVLIAEAEQLRIARKFDLAAASIKKAEQLFPDLKSLPYFRFLIEQDKGNLNEALALAEQAIRNLPNDVRMLHAYEFAVKRSLENGDRKHAEELCLSAIRLEPENEKWKVFFKESFGYEPSVTNKEK